jgi:hypothetical protein
VVGRTPRYTSRAGRTGGDSARTAGGSNKAAGQAARIPPGGAASLNLELSVSQWR